MMEIVSMETAIEAYNDANIQNQDIHNFWIDDKNYSGVHVKINY